VKIAFFGIEGKVGAVVAAGLRDAGILTEDEFAAEKAKILNG
jgi:hypothetical protein